MGTFRAKSIPPAIFNNLDLRIAGDGSYEVPLDGHRLEINGRTITIAQGKMIIREAPPALIPFPPGQTVGP